MCGIPFAGAFRSDTAPIPQQRHTPETTAESTFIVPTIVCGCLLVVSLIVCIFLTNKWLNVIRLYVSNERLSSTEEGERLLEVRAYLDAYDGLLDVTEVETETETE